MTPPSYVFRTRQAHGLDQRIATEQETTACPVLARTMSLSTIEELIWH